MGRFDLRKIIEYETKIDRMAVDNFNSYRMCFLMDLLG
jgi:hypothetical protein